MPLNQVYELSTGFKSGVLLGHYNTVTCCVYSDYQQTLYSGAHDRNILVWTAETGEYREEPIKTNKSRSLVPKRSVTEDAWSDDEGS